MVPLYISIWYTFVEWYRWHFVPRSISMFQATWIFQPSATSQVFRPETFQYDVSREPDSSRIGTKFPSDQIVQRKNTRYKSKYRNIWNYWDLCNFVCYAKLAAYSDTHIWVWDTCVHSSNGNLVRKIARQRQHWDAGKCVSTNILSITH